MKKLSALFFTLLFTLAAFSQKVIENPRHGLSSDTGLKIFKIELTDSSAVLWFRNSTSPGSSMSIPKNTYIVAAGSGKKLYIKTAEGIEPGKSITVPTGVIEYKLIFPKIDAGVSAVDYGEEEGNWHIYDIRIKDQPFSSFIPWEIQGHWFNTENGEWEISLLDSVVVYGKNVWKYAGVKYSGHEGSITIINKNARLNLPIKLNKNGELVLRTASKSVILGSDQAAIRRSLKKDDRELFTEPIFKYDSVVFSGYLQGYSPRIGVKTATAYVNNILTSAQDNFLINISDNGYFYVKMPFYYPHEIFLRSDLISGTIFLTPGRDLFVMIDPELDSPLFMGKDALLNTDFQELDKINSINYQELQAKILKMSPFQFKNYLLELKNDDLRMLDSMKISKPLTAKAMQLKKIDIEARYAYTLMDYNSMWERAYRTAHNIPSSQRVLPAKPETHGEGFYDFITSELTNNPLSVLSNDYYFYINRLKYHEITRTGTTTYSIAEIMRELVNAGIELTEEEKAMKADLDKNFIPEAEQEFSSYLQKYNKQYNEFTRKYSQLLGEMTKEERQNASTQVRYLTDHGVELTDDEKEMLKAKSLVDNSEGIKKNHELMGKYTRLIENIYSVRSKDISLVLNRKAGETRKENLEKTLNIHRGFATDIMDAQDECRKIVSEASPIPAERLQLVLKSVNTPFIAWYIEKCNNDAVVRLAAAKKEQPSAGIRLRSVAVDAPRTKADVLFETMMNKYKGKVVYVDFWATWCGPCRSENERIKPVKETFAGKNIVFVYITNPSSPKETYDNMIPGIGGEHYRLTSDEWNYLCSKFNISGIPHTVLVDKEGTVVDSHLMYMDNNKLQVMLQKLIDK